MQFAIKPVAHSLKRVSVPLMLLSLAACASPGFKADVSRFQSQLPAPQGESFAVVADDPKLAGGLEFAQYARTVESQMAALGYTLATPDTASLLVRFDYGVDKGKQRIRSTGTGFYDPFYSSFYGRHYRPYFRNRARFRRGYAFGFYDPWLGGGQQIRSYTVYTSGIDMKIDRKATGERLFEGKAQALSTSNRLGYLVPNLVDAMFTDFPGNSGENLRITIKPEEGNKVRRIN
jgi:hypothetical protein